MVKISLVLLFKFYFFIFVSSQLQTVFRRICPVEKEWLEFRRRMMCNFTKDNDNYDCTSDVELVSTLHKSSLVLLHRNQWGLLRNVSNNLAFCGIKHLVVNVDSVNDAIPEYCPHTRSETVLFFGLSNDINEFIEEYQRLTSCDLSNNTITNKYARDIHKLCSNVIWLSGQENCGYNTMQSKGITSQIVIGDTYWEKSGVKRLLPNRTLKVGTLISPPFMNKTVVNGVTTYFGVAYELINLIAQEIGFNFEMNESRSSGNGLMEMLFNQEIDIAAASFTITEARSKKIDFTTSFFFEEVGIIIRKPPHRIEDDLWKMFSLFNYTIWLAIFIATLTSWFTLHLLHKFAATELNTAFTKLSHCGWYIFSSMLNQPEDMSPATWSVQNFLTFFWIYAFAVLSIYSGGLIAMLTTSMVTVPFDSLDGLADYVQRGKYRICTQAGSAFSTMLLKATKNPYAALGDYLRKNQQFLGTMEYCTQQLLSNTDVAYLEEMTVLKDLQITNCNDTTNFKLIILEETFFPGNFAFAVQKGSALLSILSYQISDAVEAGLIPGWMSNYSQHQHFCSLAGPSELENHIEDPLSVFELGGPFILLCIGLFISITAFLVELYKILHSKRKHFSSKTVPTTSVEDISLHSKSPSIVPPVNVHMEAFFQ